LTGLTLEADTSLLEEDRLLIYQPDGRLYPPDEVPFIRSALDGGSSECELIFDVPHGARRTLLAQCSSRRAAGGQPAGTLVTLADISDRKQAEADTLGDAIRSQLLATLSQRFLEAGLDVRAVMDTIVRQVSALSGDTAVIRLLGDDEISFGPFAFHTPLPGGDNLLRELLSVRRDTAIEGVAGRVVLKSEPLFIPQVDIVALQKIAPLRFRPALDRYPLSSLMVVPLITGGRVMGVLALARLRSERSEAYTPADLIFYQAAAARAAAVIDNARRFSAENRRARDLDALQSATVALMTTLDLDALLGYILEAAARAVASAEQAAVYLVRPATGELRLSAARGGGRVKRYAAHPAGALAGSAANRAAARCVLDRQPALLNGDELMDPDSARSVLAAPLLFEDRALGALTLESARPAAFNENDLNLLVSLAAATATALRNANLHGEVQRQAITDPLTAQYNRRGLNELGQRELDRARHFSRPLSALLVDIDYFKAVNDGYSHTAGDEVLAGLAARLSENLRDVDVVARYGGEEFAILLPETDAAEARHVAERLRTKAMNEFFTQAGAVTITISIGVVTSLPNEEDLAGFLHRADLALYSAKRLGRNRVEAD
jgi:diguanylate cyclase (GGDEF)-like protein